MNLYERLKSELREKLEEEKIKYPFITENVSKDLKEKQFWVDLKYSTYLYLKDLWQNSLKGGPHPLMHEFFKDDL